MEMTHGMTAVGMIRIVLLSWVGDLETTAIIALLDGLGEVVVGGEVLKFHIFQLVSYFPVCLMFWLPMSLTNCKTKLFGNCQEHWITQIFAKGDAVPEQ